MWQRKPKGRGESRTTSKKGLRTEEKGKEGAHMHCEVWGHSGSTPSSSLAPENCATIVRNKEVGGELI